MKRTKVANAEVEDRPIEQDDFDWIVLHHQRQIYRTLLFLVHDADAAENLTQECFLRAFRRRSSFRGESSLATWLVRIAINLAYDQNRNRRWAFWRRMTHTNRMDRIRALDHRPSPEQAAIHSELIETIQSEVEKLSFRKKTVFMLRFVEEMPLEQIAEVMDLELGTVKTHLYRATEAIRGVCARLKT